MKRYFKRTTFEKFLYMPYNKEYIKNEMISHFTIPFKNLLSSFDTSLNFSIYSLKNSYI